MVTEKTELETESKKWQSLCFNLNHDAFSKLKEVVLKVFIMFLLCGRLKLSLWYKLGHNTFPCQPLKHPDWDIFTGKY